MNKFNSQALIRDFPKLCRQARRGSQSSMLYGFAVSDGWFQILYELCTKIEARCVAAGVDDVKWPAYAQVKEKFGVLRVYLDNHSGVEISDLIKEAVGKSNVTCEICGKPGHMFTGNWHYVRCDKCESNKQSLLARRDAEYDAQEARGGYRAVIDEAFAQVDAAAAAPELSDEALQKVCDASKAAGGEVGKRSSILYDLGDEKIFVHSVADRDGDHEGKPLPDDPTDMTDGKIKCYCGTTTDVHDEGVHQRYKDVMNLRLKKEKEEFEEILRKDPHIRSIVEGAAAVRKMDMFDDLLPPSAHAKEDVLDTFFVKRRMFPNPAKSIKEILELVEMLKRPDYMEELDDRNFDFSNAQGRAIDVSRSLMEEALRITGNGHVVDAINSAILSYMAEQ